MSLLPERPLSFVRRLRFLLFPPCCPLCGNVIPMNRLFCENCEPNVLNAFYEESYWLENGKPLRAVALWAYEDQARQMLHDYKFRGQIDYREALGAALAELVRAADDSKFDLVTAVPSDKDRVRELGFDHAGELALQAANQLYLPYRAVIFRTRKVAFQHTLSREQRIHNLENVFAVREDLAGLRVLLVDDIITTGTSMRTCAEALVRAGAAEVLAVAVAKTIR